MLLPGLSTRISHTMTYSLVKAQTPISIFLAGPVGEMSKSKISIGRPRVVHAFGIYPSTKKKKGSALTE